MSPISVAFTFIAGYLVVGVGAFIVCNAFNYMRANSGARLAAHQVVTGLCAIGGGIVLTVAGLFGVASLALR